MKKYTTIGYLSQTKKEEENYEVGSIDGVLELAAIGVPLSYAVTVASTLSGSSEVSSRFRLRLLSLFDTIEAISKSKKRERQREAGVSVQ